MIRNSDYVIELSWVELSWILFMSCQDKMQHINNAWSPMEWKSLRSVSLINTVSTSQIKAYNF